MTISHPQEPQNTHVAVIGAGIVGMSCALWLQRHGFKVTVFDGKSPGSGTSYGNACTIADYACVPVNDPGLFKRLPSLLFSSDSPLSLDPLYALKHLPWFFSFLRSCSQKEVTRITNALGQLLLSTNEGLDPLIAMSKSHALFENHGCMYVYQSLELFEKARSANQSRADNGVIFSELGSDEIRELEPGLKIKFAKGLLFNNARHVLNPKHLVERYFETFVNQLGHYENQHITKITHGAQTGPDITLSLANGKQITADKVVICCGAFSKKLTGAGTSFLPLDTERGYHVQFKDKQSLLTRPVGWAEAGLYATPMNEGLRFAGTVELGGLSEKMNPRNTNYLTKKAHQMVELTDHPSSNWLGYRPTMPDSLPVIDYSPESKNILLAFGHQHIGLTLAGITGKVIADLALGKTPKTDLSAFSASRFGSPFHKRRPIR